VRSVAEGEEVVFHRDMAKRMSLVLLTFLWRATFAAQGQEGLVDSADAQHISFPDARLTVNGLAWFGEDKPALRRLRTK